MSLIKDDLNELTRIDTEIKRVLSSLRSLRSTKKIIEGRMTKFLKDRDFEGGKVGESVILLKEKTTEKTKTKKEVDNNLASLFLKYGISNPDVFMQDLKNSTKDNVVRNVIKVTHRKTNKGL